ncbi:MAG: gamma carbonic anhydrase family protein [Deltaproteobacteria bacterium]|nr:gamma carbonic anhydrase family protein [Deltaproteobacteria bacterium]MBW2359769.1 gamma carbonic anhydrase family protein [Deltaproteobacteria bacterium]
MGATTSASDRDPAIVRPFRATSPRIAPDAWVAPGAVVVGDVEIGSDSSVWYGSIVRGDVNRICVGARSNLQDQCVVHVTRDRFACHIGDEVTIGHHATVHGCVVEDGVLVGIGAIVLDGARVGAGAMVGAGAVVPPGTQLEPGVLAVGVPARVVRALTPEERERNREITLGYVELARAHAESAVG